MSYVTDGAMLSKSWAAHRHDGARRSNLYHGLARIILSLGKTRLPRISSFALDNHGIISLTNRRSLYGSKHWKTKESARALAETTRIQQLTSTFSIFQTVIIIAYTNSQIQSIARMMAGSR